MTAKELYESLLEGAISILEPTCDGLIVGDGDVEVKKVGVCFKLTAELIDKAVAEGVNVIVTHEPTFSSDDRGGEFYGVDRLKYDKLIASGITLYRFHDHAHHREDDYIHTGFIKSLGLKIKRKFDIESLGVRRYELDEEITTRELAKRIRDILGIELVRIVGRDDHPLKVVCLGLGGVGFAQINKLFDPGCDLFITGEVGEVIVDENVRDACYFGMNKSVLVLGHYGSEYAGMRYLAEELDRFVPTVFLDGSEVYHGI